MSDVIDRLRAIYPEHHQVNQWCVRYEAATEIERLRAENEKLRAALKPFAEQAGRPVNIYEHEGVRMAFVDQDVLDRLCRAAAAALKETRDD